MSALRKIRAEINRFTGARAPHGYGAPRGYGQGYGPTAGGPATYSRGGGRLSGTLHGLKSDLMRSFRRRRY